MLWRWGWLCWLLMGPPHAKAETDWPIQVAHANSLKQPGCLSLSHLASGNSLIDLRGQLRITRRLDRLLHRLQANVFCGRDF